MQQPLQIGFVTDEVSRDIAQSLQLCREWGVGLFELREGRNRRFPYFDDDELRLVRDAIDSGARITAVSPGIFKRPIEDKASIENDLEVRLPESLRIAKDLGCPTVIAFGFEIERDDPGLRSAVVDTMRRAADLAAEADMIVAVENEPAFWFDTPEQCASLIEEIGHPAVKLNWDPANMHWGGVLPTKVDFDVALPHIVNLHVKDFAPHDKQMPWRPVGEGVTPWEDILSWVVDARNDGLLHLNHLTIETHYLPAESGSRRSLENVRSMLSKLQTPDS